jgi:hypothetical protein
MPTANAREARKTCRFSMDWWHHEAVTDLSLSGYNSSWPARALALGAEWGRRVEGSPVMAAGSPGHLWSTSEWRSHPAVQYC